MNRHAPCLQPNLVKQKVEQKHMDEVLKEFLIESYDSPDRLDQDLVGLERIPTDNRNEQVPCDHNSKYSSTH